jgi:hypothetical protein
MIYNYSLKKYFHLFYLNIKYKIHLDFSINTDELITLQYQLLR